jgi:RHS repeat-associated protein
VSGSYGGLTQHDTLTVTPASAIQLTNLTISPSSVSGGTTATGTVTMSAPAPTGGLVVSLASRHRNFATVPSGVTVPAGATTASFTITAQPVKSTHTVDITATYASVTKTASLTVTKSVASLNILGRIASIFRHVPLSLSVSTHVAQPLASGLPSRYSLYTPELNLMAETETTTASSPAINYEYVWFGGRPVAQIDLATNTTHWAFTDHLGTPILQTNAAGAVDWRAEYEPYGTVDAFRAGASRHQPLRFPGQEEVTSTDRLYNVFRWYRGGWGRYTEADPMLGKDPNANDVYGYATENPLSYTDQTGLLAEAVCSEIAVSGINTPFYHCRLRVTCKECTGGNYGRPFDTTVGLERNRKTGDLEINEAGSYSGQHFDLGISEADSCNFGKCVRSNAAFFKRFEKSWKTQYSLTEPNRWNEPPFFKY